MENQIKRKGIMLVISSPSGAGKTTLSKALLIANENIKLSVSVTTRKPRPSEKEAIDYYFISEEKYNELLEQDAFLETAKVFGSYYGTLKSKVEESINQGQDILFDIDWQGTIQLKSLYEENVVSIFILPPSMVELEKRLQGRAQDDAETINNRMKKAHIEISHYDKYDYVIINHDVGDSLKKINAILHSERLKRSRQNNLDEFIAALLK